MRIKFNSLIVSIILCSVITSCGSKKSISTEVTKPALVNLHQDIKRIGILDRSIVSKNESFLDELDKILSIEGANLDREGAKQAVLSLKSEVSKSNTFSEVKLINIDAKNNPGGSVFPAALSWDEISIICANNNIDGLFVLSLYDTDATATYDTFNTKVKGPLGIEVPAIHHSVVINTIIKTGWRIYDPIKRVISDELEVSQKVRTTGRGINPVKAIEAAKNRKQSVLQISQKIAQDYASRLLPYKGKIYRKYYTSDTPNFEIAKRYVETGKWEEASVLWEKETNNKDKDIAGQACYNMAFYNEIKGDYNRAKEWATKAYTEYENKLALKYLDDLDDRIEEVNMLNKK
ncbi:DUF6340 family protein [uncultured Lacinutrix sp.]|uniref:DUF6340 family protein n=1 Tax=uncultured Lacinutrix sp. TaxID=574032 RepID=UPI00261E2B33|nr:DUF6340 family protein [uncultured Lacinutrix sp.]